MWRTLLLTAFVLQCVVVQTHVHAAPFAGRLSASPIDRQSVEHPTFATAFELCPLCWEAAVAGHYSLPDAAVVPSAPVTAFWIVASVAGAFTLTRYPLGWLSRAPPQ
jgi:hypothetical protein